MVPTTLTYRDVLFEPDGSRRSRAEAVSLFGVRLVDVAEVYEAINKLKHIPAKLSVPSRVFISYRWGTDEENRWVYDLADQLRERGYEVLYDKFLDQSARETVVGEIVSRIASCHIFLMIVDPGYIERVGAAENQFLARGWAYVEFRIAEFMPIQLFRWGLLRDGDEVPRGSVLPTERDLGNVADVRTSEKLKIALDNLFPIVRDIPDKDKRQEAEQLLTQAVWEALDGDLSEASNLARKAINLIPKIKDGYRMFALCALLANRIEEAYSAVDNIMKTDQVGGPGSPVIRRTNYLLAAQVLNNMGNHRNALQVVTHDKFDEFYHLTLANCLANLGQERAAFAHITSAFRCQPALERNWEKYISLISRIYAIDAKYDAALLARLIKLLYPSPGVLEITQFDKLAVGRAGVVIPRVQFLAESEIPEYHYNVFFNTAIVISALRGIPQEIFSFTKIYSEQISGHKYEVHCSSCRHAISFSEVREVLCHTCGAELIPSPGMTLANLPVCPYCKGNVFTLLAPALDGAYCPCPYCRAGQFQP
jgi:tetratricopeptide (TPR) repeat protein